MVQASRLSPKGKTKRKKEELGNQFVGRSHEGQFGARTRYNTLMGFEWWTLHILWYVNKVVIKIKDKASVVCKKELQGQEGLSGQRTR